MKRLVEFFFLGHSFTLGNSVLAAVDTLAVLPLFLPAIKGLYSILTREGSLHFNRFLSSEIVTILETSALPDRGRGSCPFEAPIHDHLRHQIFWIRLAG